MPHSFQFYNPQYHATPLHKAAINGHTEVCMILLGKGADVNAANEVSDYFAVLLVLCVFVRLYVYVSIVLFVCVYVCVFVWGVSSGLVFVKCVCGVV